jgi:YesN/AraC family two-component response regulator
VSEPKISGGYVLLPRKIIDSEIFKKPPLYLKVWIYLLQIAQHADYKQLERGQLRTSIPEIIEACSWYVGYRKEQPTKDQIHKILDWMRNSYEASDEDDRVGAMITTTRATHGLLVNIDNYSFYQDPKNYGSSSESISEKETAATREKSQPDNINNKAKKMKNKINNTSQKNKFSEDSIEIILSKELFSCMKNNNPGAKEPNFQTWAKSMDLMLRRDNRTIKGIQDMINFSQNNSFWMGNILSAAKLREKYDQLYIQCTKGKQPANEDWRDF